VVARPGLVLRGVTAWRRAIAEWSRTDLNRLVKAVRRAGIDLMAIHVPPAVWPLEMRAPRCCQQRTAAQSHFRNPEVRGRPLRSTRSLPDHDATFDADLLDLARVFEGFPNTAPQLIACARALPETGQWRIVDEALRDARAAGLRLPGTLVFEWRDGRPDICAGAFRGSADRCTVYLSVHASPSELRATVCHELKHVSDYTLGLMQTLSRGELEERATVFAAEMMGWR
jgi:hypothetical protein